MCLCVLNCCMLRSFYVFIILSFFLSLLWLSPFCQLFPLSIFSPMRLCTSLHLPQLIFSPSLSPFLSKSLDSLHPSALIMDRMQLQHYRIHGSRSWDTAVFGASVKPTPAKIVPLAVAQRPALGALADSFCPKSPFCFYFSCANLHTPT